MQNCLKLLTGVPVKEIDAIDMGNASDVNKAKELLRRRELRMTDISLAVGYEDQSYFTKVFKRVAGMLPREYREKILVSRKD